MTEIELKNCPFCEAKLIKEAYGHRHGYNPLKSCPLSDIAWLVDSENFAKWNTRPIEAQLQTRLTLAVEALEYILGATEAYQHSGKIYGDKINYDIAEKTKQTLAEIKGETPCSK